MGLKNPPMNNVTTGRSTLSVNTQLERMFESGARRRSPSAEKPAPSRHQVTKNFVAVVAAQTGVEVAHRLVNVPSGTALPGEPPSTYGSERDRADAS